MLGALIEKALTTPQQYPLTLNALVLACNQTSNRDPVVEYDESTVEAALFELKEGRLVRFVLPSHGRSAVRYRHVVDEQLGLDDRQLALLAVLVLRGPQTVGELRARTERQASFSSLSDVERELQLLAAHEAALVLRLERRPGQKEERWRQSLAEANDARPDGSLREVAGLDGEGGPARAPSPGQGQTSDQPSGPAPALAALAEEVAGLRAEVGELRQALAELRQNLGD